MSSNFPNAAPAIEDLALETNQDSPPETYTDSPSQFLDAALPILIKANEHSQTLQDNGIRKEFHHQHTSTEAQLSSQRGYIASELSSVEKGFEKVFIKFKEYDGKLKSANCKLDTCNRWGDLAQERIIEQRRYINEKLRVVDGKVERLDRKVEKWNTEFDQLRGKLANSKAERGFHQVVPVGVYDDNDDGGGGGYSVPEGVPKTVRSFWGLKRQSRLAKLIALVKAYKITTHELLQPEQDDASSDDQDEEDDDDEDMDESQKELVCLETLVEAYPEKVHQILAHRLGLDYHKISIYMSATKSPSVAAPATNGVESPEDSEAADADEDKKQSSKSRIILPAFSTPEVVDDKIVLTLNSI